MVEDSDWACVVGIFDDLEEALVVLALANGEDLWVGFGVHAIEIEAEEVGFHFIERFLELVELAVGVMEIVDDADVVCVVLFAHVFADGDEILWVTAPPTMII